MHGETITTVRAESLSALRISRNRPLTTSIYLQSDSYALTSHKWLLFPTVYPSPSYASDVGEDSPLHNEGAWTVHRWRCHSPSTISVAGLKHISHFTLPAPSELWRYSSQFDSLLHWSSAFNKASTPCQPIMWFSTAGAARHYSPFLLELSLPTPFPPQKSYLLCLSWQNYTPTCSFPSTPLLNLALLIYTEWRWLFAVIPPLKK